MSRNLACLNLEQSRDDHCDLFIGKESVLELGGQPV